MPSYISVQEPCRIVYTYKLVIGIYRGLLFSHCFNIFVSLLSYTDMRRLTTGLRSQKCVVRRFRLCANIRMYLHKRR